MQRLGVFRVPEDLLHGEHRKFLCLQERKKQQAPLFFAGRKGVEDLASIDPFFRFVRCLDYIVLHSRRWKTL